MVLGQTDPFGAPALMRAQAFEEYLVNTAINNNYGLKELQYEQERSKAQLQSAKRRWANGVNINFGGLITDSITYVQNPAPGQSQVQLPGYNFGMGISLGPILQQRGITKEFTSGTKVADARIQLYMAELRREVLARYRKYLLAIEIYGTRLQAQEVAATNRALLNEMFVANRAEFEEMNQAESAYFRAVELRQQAEAEVQIARYDLEEIVGEKWDVLERVRTTMQKRG